MLFANLLSNLNTFSAYLLPGLNQRIKESSLSRLTRGFVVYASSSNEEDKLSFSGRVNTNFDGVEPFRGKSGSVSFSGITHHLVEEDRLVSAPFEESGGSFLWIWGPIALISSLLLPQFVVNNVFGGFIKGEVTSGRIFISSNSLNCPLLPQIMCLFLKYVID